MTVVKFPDTTMLPSRIIDYWMPKISARAFKVLVILYAYKDAKTRPTITVMSMLTGMTKYQARFGEEELKYAFYAYSAREDELSWMGGDE